MWKKRTFFPLSLSLSLSLFSHKEQSKVSHRLKWMMRMQWIGYRGHEKSTSSRKGENWGGPIEISQRGRKRERERSQENKKRKKRRGDKTSGTVWPSEVGSKIARIVQLMSRFSGCIHCTLCVWVIDWNFPGRLNFGPSRNQGSRIQPGKATTCLLMLLLVKLFFFFLPSLSLSLSLSLFSFSFTFEPKNMVYFTT